ncbi:hypothetical protein AB0H71_05110 [Nocardia sp. NPDC050697]|uniref:hypothetical protein n=1 Tax=Nocardia sp. NPDC050697 TaxID=3155158 RepID=UPI0033E00075
MTDLSAADLIRLFAAEFELCALAPGEHVVVLSEPTSRGDYVAAAFGAAQLAGAHVVSAVVPAGSPTPVPSTHTGSGAGLVSVLTDTAVQQLLQNADFVVDLTREGFIHAPVQQEILAARTRILFVCDAPDVLARNLATAADSGRVARGVELIKGAATMRVTSAAGTDLTVDLTDSHPGAQKGFVDRPGTWDHWPSTMVMCWPQDSRGRLVLSPGDILLPFKEYVRDEVVLEISGGHIDAVTGAADAAFLERFFADSDDKWARSLSHMGWGMMRSADWFATAMYAKHEIMGMDARAYAGNFLWSTGPHPFLGREESYAHLDIAMRGCTVRIGDVTVVADGELVE